MTRTLSWALAVVDGTPGTAETVVPKTLRYGKGGENSGPEPSVFLLHFTGGEWMDTQAQTGSGTQ